MEGGANTFNSEDLNNWWMRQNSETIDQVMEDEGEVIGYSAPDMCLLSQDDQKRHVYVYGTAEARAVQICSCRFCGETYFD